MEEFQDMEVTSENNCPQISVFHKYRRRTTVQKFLFWKSSAEKTVHLFPIFSA